MDTDPKQKHEWVVKQQGQQSLKTTLLVEMKEACSILNKIKFVLLQINIVGSSIN